MTTNDARPAATATAPAAGPTMPAPRTWDDESSAGSSGTAADGARGDAAPRGEPRPGVTGDDAAEAASLIAHGRAVDYRSRWAVVQGDFIDEPRNAVTDADTLVGEILDHLAETFREQRESLERHWAGDESTTEDLRIALRRYRTFFDRLLAL